MKQSSITLLAVVVAAIVLVATLAYLNTGEEQQPYTDNGDDDGGDDTPPASNLPIATDFTLPVVDGDLVSLYSLRGKVVVIDFFATWCSPCATQIEYLKDIYGEYSTSEVVILSIDVDNSES